MKRPGTAAFALALALSSTGALAVSGDRWHGSNIESSRAAPVEVTRVHPDGVIVHEKRTLTRDPVLVEREYVYESREPRDIVVLREDDRDFVGALNPHTDNRIGRGLFPENGPNDFGA